MSEPTASTNPAADGPDYGRVLVIIPTYNESENIDTIVGRLRSAVPVAEAIGPVEEAMRAVLAGAPATAG